MGKKKIGIISEFNMHNVNYGNRLQAYALNKYLNDKYQNCVTDTLDFNFYDKKLRTQKMPLGYFIAKVVAYLRKKMLRNEAGVQSLDERLKQCNRFSREHINLCERAMSWKELCKSNYDGFIVGSDVVWSQGKYAVGRMRFLDFTAEKKFIKISYAASFGRDWIPRENIEAIKRCLGDFHLLSVREKSSVSLLQTIGINKAIHTLDPTLLLTEKDWSALERQPEGIPNRYIFAYLLGTSVAVRKSIMNMSVAMGIPVVTIPYAHGNINVVDTAFGDIRLIASAPEEWIWLIHHAEYILTDSFHGIVFSTIFSKKFISIERQEEKAGSSLINNRMVDFLNTICQQDKYVDLSKNVDLASMIWDYAAIWVRIEAKKSESERFLHSAIELILNKGNE